MYPKDNVFNIYYNIGKRLPFQVKRSQIGLKGSRDIDYRYEFFQHGSGIHAAMEPFKGCRQGAGGENRAEGVRAWVLVEVRRPCCPMKGNSWTSTLALPYYPQP